MGVRYRGSDGRPQNDDQGGEPSTRKIHRPQKEDQKGGDGTTPTEDTEAVGPQDNQRLGGREDKTQKSGGETEPITEDTSGPSTQIWRPNKSAEKTKPSGQETKDGTTEKSGSELTDPVVGWLVITQGPGRGNDLALGYGMNTLGRNNTERIPLNFGDNQVSRSQHAMVTYDPRSRRFYVQHGGGQNLTYLNGEPLLTPHELEGQEEISVGDTTLRFVPLCGPGFDWQDQ